jgi:uncharacterized protein RhaS with RHS repeats
VGGINLYGYVLNNPVNFVDPLGLVADWIFPTPDSSYIYMPYRNGNGNWVDPIPNYQTEDNSTTSIGMNLPPGADSTTGPLAFYAAGAALMVTGSELTTEGAGIMALGGPPGWIGGGIVTGIGVSMTGFGAWTFYQGWKVDSDPCP